MNSDATFGLGVGSGVRLRGLRPSIAGRRPWLSRRGLRIAVAAADVAQTACLGLAAHALASGTETVSWKALLLGLLVAGIASVVRGAARSTGAGEEGSAVAESVWAALSTAGSVCVAGLMVWILAPHVVTRVLVEWFSEWALASSLLSAGLRIAGQRIKRELCGGMNVIVVDEGVPAGAAAPGHDGRWNIASRIDAREAGWLDRLREAVSDGGADVVVLALAGSDAGARIAGVCRVLADQPVRVCLAIETAALGRTPRRMERFGDAAMVDLLCDPHGQLDGAAKRAVDIVLSAAALAVLSPALAVVAVAVRAESPGPALFRQKRFGAGGRQIEVFKFRTMRNDVCDATGETRTRARDPRVTRIGRVLRRTSIDELPQLVNVLRGEMSLVGPRPHPLHMRIGEEFYFDAVQHYRMRHLVKPGMTGWAQINGSRGEVDTMEKAVRRVELDLWYLENWTFWVDMWIIARTLGGGFLTKGAD